MDGHFSRGLANPQVAMSVAAETAADAGDNSGNWPHPMRQTRRGSVSWQLANREVSGMSSGQTKGDLTVRVGGLASGRTSPIPDSRQIREPEEGVKPGFACTCTRHLHR